MNILTGKTKIRIWFNAQRHPKGIAIHSHIFLPHHTIAALWNGTARHNTQGAALWHFFGKEIARTFLTDNLKLGRISRIMPGRFLCHKGIAIQR